MTALLAVVAAVALVALGFSRRRNTLLHSDLRARERMLEALEERLASARADVFRFASALDELPQGVVVWTAEGQEILRNRSARAFVGVRHADVLVAQAIDHELQAALQGAVRRRNLDVFGPPRRMLSLTAVPVGADGAVVVVDDMSERRRLDAMRRDFVANMSHELKTPVGAIGVLAEAIADSPDLDDTVRRLAERMTGEALRVGRIIDDLLSLSEIEAADTDGFDTHSARSLVEEAVQRVQPVAAANGITLDVRSVDGDHAVCGDRRQLVPALSNLLENACKYSDAGSTVVVRSRQDDAWLELDVEDHGVGIPSADLDRVFERFYRVDRARSRSTGGTGLGLAIVRHVAANHGGEVLVESTEGVGSTFTLRIPLGAAA